MDQRHSLGDADTIHGLLADGGFQDVQIETVIRKIRMSGVDFFARLNAMAVVGMSPAAKSMSEEQRAETIMRITADSVGALQSYVEGNDIVFGIGSNMAVARRS